MHLALIVNSVVCALGAVLGLFFAGGSIVSIANMRVPWTGLLIVAALLVPAAFVISGIGAWLAYNPAAPHLAMGLIALPWAYSALFVVAMLFSFK